MFKITKNHPSSGEVTIQMDKDIFTRFMNVKVDGKEYSFLGAGSFNIAYKSTTAPYEVYKEPFSKTELTDFPDRAVRLWNDINPTIPARLAKNGKGWIAPFVSGNLASEKEISDALIDIYMRTGRVVVDAFVKNNFIKMNNGAVACIDIGLALQLETRLEEEKSHASLGFWDAKGMKKVYDSVFSSGITAHYPPFITNTIQALLYCTLHAPDERDLEFLQTNRRPVILLAEAYKNNTSPEHAIPNIFEKQVGPADKLVTTTSESPQLNAASFDPNHPEYRAASQYCKTPDDLKKLSDAFAALQAIELDCKKLSLPLPIEERIQLLEKKLDWRKTVYEIRKERGTNYTGPNLFRRAEESAGAKYSATLAMLQELRDIKKFLEGASLAPQSPLESQAKQIKNAAQQGELGKLYQELQDIKKDLRPDTPTFRNFNLR